MEVSKKKKKRVQNAVSKKKCPNVSKKVSKRVQNFQKRVQNFQKRVQKTCPNVSKIHRPQRRVRS